MARLKVKYSKLTGAQLQQECDDRQISQEQFARICRVSEATKYRWFSGQMDGHLPGIIDVILWLGDGVPGFWTQVIDGIEPSFTKAVKRRKPKHEPEVADCV